MGRVLAIDYGQKRIGLALSDETRSICSRGFTLTSLGTRPGIRPGHDPISTARQGDTMPNRVPSGPTRTNSGHVPSDRGFSAVAAQIAELVVAQDVELVILGLPLSQSGRPSTRSREVERFRAELAKVVTVPVELVDERFTTALAQRYLGESRGPQGTRSRIKGRIRVMSPGKHPVDVVAATILLEDFLKRQVTSNRQQGE